MNLLINMDVEDLAQAVRLYSDALGLTTGRSFGDAGVEMLGGSAPIYLLHKATGTKCFGSAARSFRKCPITHPTVCAQARSACRGDRLQ